MWSGRSAARRDHQERADGRGTRKKHPRRGARGGGGAPGGRPAVTTRNGPTSEYKEKNLRAARRRRFVTASVECVTRKIISLRRPSACRMGGRRHSPAVRAESATRSQTACPWPGDTAPR